MQNKKEKFNKNKIKFIMLKLIRKAISAKNLIRSYHISTINNIKSISIVEDESKKSITIEGKYLTESELENKNLLKFPDDHETRCSFCKLEKHGIYVQYTDVLVLRQFLREDGTVLPKKITGLCKRQQTKLYVLVKHANNAGLILNLQQPLLNGQKPNIDPEKRREHLKWNNSYDTYEELRRKYKYL